MRVVVELQERLRCLLFRTGEEQELDEELRFHLEMATRQNMEAGMTRREARRQARLRFGGVERFKEEVREARGIRVFEDLGADLRYAVRMLRRAPAFSATVILILALGIGANTALFGAAKRLLLDRLPVVDPDGLVRLRSAGDNDMMAGGRTYGRSAETAAGERVRTTFSLPLFEQLRRANDTLSGMFATAPMSRVNVIVDGQAEMASGLLVSGSYFDVLGVRPLLGRAIGPEDDDLAASPVALISHPFWERRFGLDPDVVGRTITVTNVVVTIAGVLPPDYIGVQRPHESAADLHLPLAWYAEWFPQSERREPAAWAARWWVQIMGRLKPGVTAAQVRGNLDGPFRSGARAGWDEYAESLRGRLQRGDRTAVPRLLVDSGSRGIYDPRPATTRQTLILGVVVGLVLLIVCTNVANMLLSRATARRRELAVRRSVGATRARIVQQLLTEGLVLSVLGGTLGILVAVGAGRWLPVDYATVVDWSLFSFVAGLSLVTGVAFSLVPALRATGTDSADALKDGGRGVARFTTVLGKALLVVQVAVSVVLLVGAGLFLKTLSNLRGVEVGFDPESILLFQVDPRLNGYDTEQVAAVYDRVVESVRTVPGVLSASMSHVAFLTNSMFRATVFLDDDKGQDGRESYENRVSPAFFQTMEIPLLVGRLFDRGDSADAPPVAIVNEAAALAYFGTDNPVGRRLGRSPIARGQVEVVGVVRDVKYLSVRGVAPPTVYWPHAQQLDGSGRMYQLKTAGAPDALVPAVRDAVRRVDPTLPLLNVSTYARRIEEQFSGERLLALTYSTFGGLAALLASIGLFGLASYGVAQRTNEIGIRMALGAQRTDVTRMVLRESLTLVVAGVGVGLAAAVATGRLLEGLLFELAPTDVPTFVQAAVLMVVVAAAAAYPPARRAARLDPLVALQSE